MNINLHIERLILDGLPIDHSQGFFVKDALESELRRLLATSGLNPNFQLGGAAPSIDATPGIHVKQNSSAMDLGRQIAKAVYGGIGK